MTETPLDDRRFSDQEIREILRMAVEKAPSRALRKREDEGLTLAELKAIAGEVGIDPTRVEDAARSVAMGGTGRAYSVLGGPTVLNFERRIDGEVDFQETPEILALIRRIMGRQGEVSEIHGSLEWTAKGDIGDRYVTLTSRDGNTTVTGSANLTNAAIVTYLPAGLVGLITSLIGLIKFVQDGSQVALVIGLAVLPILYPLLRSIFRRVSRSETQKLQQVVDQLARLPAPPEGS